MNFSEDTHQQIEDYLNGNLNAEETTAFEYEINSDSQLFDAIEVSKKMKLQYSDEEWDSIKNHKSNKKLKELELLLKTEEFLDKKKAIQTVSDSYFKNEKAKSKNPNKFKLYYGIAAAAMLLLLLGFFFKDNKQTNQEIYSSNSNWEELPSLVSRSEINSALLSQGENAFKDKNYKLAEEKFSNYINTSTEFSVNAFLYLGISQLELENYNEALVSFNAIIRSNSIDKSKGYWYKVLVYFKMEDKINAIKTLEIIIENENNFNFTKAKKLLSTLKN